MKLNLYSIFDTASGIWDRPMTAQSDGEMLRAFGDIAVNQEHPIGQHPEDYSLFRVGIWDNNKGFITAEDPECLATGLEMVSKAQTVNRDNLKKFDGEIHEISNGT